MSLIDQLTYAEEQLDLVRQGVKPSEHGAKLIGKLNNIKTRISIAEKSKTGKDYSFVEIHTLSSST